MKTYLLYGDERILIEKELEKIKKFYEKDLFLEPQTYDLHESSIANIVIDANTAPFFGMKMIVVRSADFIKNINSYEIEHDFNTLIDYLQQQNESTILVFVSNVSTIHKRQKISKAMMENTNVKFFSDITGIKLTNTIMNIVTKKNMHISLENTQILVNLIGEKFSTIYQELEKLMLYKNFQGEITQKDINEVISFTFHHDIFVLIDLIMNKKPQAALELFDAINAQKDESLGIIALMSNQLRLLYQVKILNHLTEGQIASTLGVHPYRVKLAKQNAKYQIKDILLEITDLNNLEYKIKTGQINALLGLKLHILAK